MYIFTRKNYSRKVYNNNCLDIFVNNYYSLFLQADIAGCDILLNGWTNKFDSKLNTNGDFDEKHRIG